MVFGSVAALDKNTITVLNIDPVIRHRAASERLCQSRYRGAVSDPGLVLKIDQAERTGEGGDVPALLAVDVGAAHMGSSNIDSEECWNIAAFARSLGLVYLEHQARV